jgi:hypothetical protein
LHSAVLPIFNRQTIQTAEAARDFHAPQNSILRYGRLKNLRYDCGAPLSLPKIADKFFNFSTPPSFCASIMPWMQTSVKFTSF